MNKNGFKILTAILLISGFQLIVLGFQLISYGMVTKTNEQLENIQIYSWNIENNRSSSKIQPTSFKIEKEVNTPSLNF